MTQVVGYAAKWEGAGIPLVQCDFKSGCTQPSPCRSGQSNGKFVPSGSKLTHDHVDCLTLPSTGGMLAGVAPVKQAWHSAVPRMEIYSKNSDALIDCTYNVKDFDTYEKVHAFYTTYIQNASSANKALSKVGYDKLMIHFLSNYLATSGCPNSPLDGSQQSRCAYIFSSSAEGQFCAAWFKHATNTQRDIIASAVANKFPDLPECACLNRTTDPVYQAFQKSVGSADIPTGSPDCCWWLPCKNPDKFFVLSQDQGKNCSGCPKMICQNVINAMGKQNVDISHITSTIKCEKSDSTPSDPSDPSTPSDPSNPPDKGLFGDMTLLQKSLLFGVPVFLIIVGLLLFEFPGAKEFVRVHHVAFGLGFLTVSSIGGMLYWYYFMGPGKKDE